VAEPHPRTVPSSEATEALPASVTATSPQIGEPSVQPHLQPDPPPHPQFDVPAAPLRRSRRGLILAGCALLGTVIGITGQQLTSRGGTQQTATPEPSPTAAATAVPAQVDPVSANGTNFRSKAGVWESQSYATQEFGGLKKGIGLRLDLGQARSLRSVDFTALEGPITVELRAGDQASTNGAEYQLVGEPVQANGPTSLPAASGGSHRYWMIWVTKLAPTLQAKIAEPGARG
jgi:hypothetical protein